MTILKNCEESIICQFKTCKNVYEVPIFLTCCGESICHKHLDKLFSDPEKTKIKCCFCLQEFKKPEKGFKINKGIEKIINAEPGEDQKQAKISLAKLGERINKYDHLISEPDFFIHEYFNNIKEELEQKRREDTSAINNYYQNIYKQLESFENDCKAVKIDYSQLIGIDLEKYSNQFEIWKEEVKKLTVDESKFKKINADITDSINEIESKVKHIELALLNNKDVSFERPSKKVNLEDVVGRLNYAESGDFGILSGSFDTCIKLWNIDNGKCLKTLNGHTGEIFCIKLLSNTKLVSCSSDKTIKVWDILSNECIKSFDCQDATTYYVLRYNSDEFISGQQNGDIKLWNVNYNLPKKTFIGHENSIRGLELIKDRNQLVSCCRLENIKIWDVDTGKCLANLKGYYYNVIYGIKLHPNCNDLFMCTKNGLILKWNLQESSSTELIQASDNYIWEIELLPENKIASAHPENVIKIWNLTTKSLLGVLNGHQHEVLYLRYLPKDKLASSSRDGTVKIWDLNTYRCIQTLNGHSNWVKTLELIHKI